MAYTPKRTRVTLPSSLGTGYTAPAGGAIIKSMIVCVTDGGARTLTIKFGGRFVYKAYPIPVIDGQPYAIECGDWLDPAETIQWNADNSTGVDLHLTVLEKS